MNFLITILIKKAMVYTILYFLQKIKNDNLGSESGDLSHLEHHYF